MIFFRRSIESRGLKNEILAAFFIALSFLGGGVEIVYGNFFVLLFMVIFSSISHWERIPMGGHTGPPLRFIIVTIFYRVRSLFIVSTLFLFLSAIQLLPFLELFHHSIRGSGISYQEATTWSFAPKDILLFFLPDAYGYFLDMKKYWVAQCWFKTLYTGGLPFILSLIFFLFGNPVGEALSGLPNPTAAPACRQAGKGRPYWSDRGFYLSLMLLSLFLSLGKYNPLYPFVFKYVPFFNGIRYPVKFLYIFILVLSVTAGLGFEKLRIYLKKGEDKRLKHLLVLFSITCGFFLLFFVIGHKEIEPFLKAKGIDFPDFNHLSVNLYHAKRFFFYLSLFFLLLRIGHEVKWRSWAKALLIFFLIIDLYGNMGFYGKEKTSDFFKKTHIAEIVSLDRGYFRIFSTEKTISMDTPILIADMSPMNIYKERHLPSLNLLYQLHDIWGIDVIRLKRTDDLYKAFTGTPSILATHLVDLYGIKYVISVTPIEEGSPLELIYSRIEGLQGERENLLKENTIKLYRNRAPLPRACLVRDFKVMDSKAILSKMITKEFDPDKEVLLEEEPIPLRNAECRRRNGKFSSLGDGKDPQSEIRNPHSFNSLSNQVEVISETNNTLHLKVRAAGNALLVLSDTYYPGWRAFVDGKEVKIYRADYNFRAIPIEAGEQEIKFIYDPIPFKIGTFISLFTLVGIVFYFVGWARRVAPTWLFIDQFVNRLPDLHRRGS
jgi:hypothetical protein